MSSAQLEAARERLAELEDWLRPGAAHAWAMAELDTMFRSGSVPDPPPNGFLKGGLITSSSAQIDAVGRRLARLYSPWLGKRFDSNGATGVNVLAKSARLPMRAVWPTYAPEKETSENIEAFAFTTWVGAGAVDPDRRVLKIDYDLDSNPRFIRRVLDELVQIEDGVYLGKVLLRRDSSWHPTGFFVLER